MSKGAKKKSSQSTLASDDYSNGTRGFPSDELIISDGETSFKNEF